MVAVTTRSRRSEAERTLAGHPPIPRARPLTVTALLDALGQAGGMGRRIGPRLDLVRSTGPGYALRRGREMLAWSKLPRDGRRPGYLELGREAAGVVGADAVDLGRGFVELRQGEARAVVWNHWVPLDDIVTMQLALDKPLVHARLASAGIPVPDHVSFDAADLSPALAFLAQSDVPCVVKPVAMMGGSMTTSGIRTPDQLRRARLRARRRSERLMIERQVAGANYRFLFLDGELLDVIHRRSPQVAGDGRSTVRELIAAENRRRFAAAEGERPWLLTADLDAVFTLEAAGLSLGSVPPHGASVTVKTVVNANSPEDNESVRHDVSEALVAEAARAAALVGVRLAGVDVITPDRRCELAACGGVVLEVNATPGLHYHYEIRNAAEGTPVLVPILQRLLSAASATG
jgi:D-alanine-D-alanine ligase-like ATP-grasp enzyme